MRRASAPLTLPPLRVNDAIKHSELSSYLIPRCIGSLIFVITFAGCFSIFARMSPRRWEENYREIIARERDFISTIVTRRFPIDTSKGREEEERQV